ncbi:MAG: major capsid protein V20 domain-containing protein [Candidatus Fonsibacter sp.]
MTSSNMQLNGMPDKLIMCVRKAIANLWCHQTDNYATCKGISINFNKQSVLLSSMTPEQLFNNSVQSGRAIICWDEFCGCMVSCCGMRPTTATNAGTATTRSVYSGVGYNLSLGGTNQYAQ